MFNVSSAGIVVYRKEGDQILYLLLRKPYGRWEFPKGRIEQGEDPIQAAKRETREETGITELEIYPEELNKIKFTYKRGPPSKKNRPSVSKSINFFLAETMQRDVRISHEHEGFVWVNFDEAMNHLAFENTRNTLKKAKEVIDSMPK